MSNSQSPQRPVTVPERVAAYVRVSTQEQKLHGLSLPAQRDKLTEYAANNNMTIVGWYVDEGVSARKLIRKRPELQRMICDAEKGKFTRIIFIKLDRFFRSVAEYHECMKRISPVVWTTTEEEYDLTTAQGRLLVNMKLTIAELEADQTSERIKLVNEYKVKTGQPLWGKHSLPFGFMVGRDETTGRKTVVHDPAEEHIVYDLINHYLTYQSKRKLSIYLRSKYGVSFYDTSLSNYLSNPMLYGTYKNNPNYCEPYIDKTTFDRIQEISSRSIKVNTADRRVYIFSGLIRCPNCGRLMSGGTSTYSNSGGKRKYKRYRCRENSRANNCTFNKIVNERKMELLLLENLDSIFTQYVVDVDMQKAKEAERRASNIDIQQINDEIDRLNYSWQTGKIRSVEQYEKSYAELVGKLTACEAQRDIAPQVDIEHIKEILRCGWQVVYETLSDESKQAFWRSFIRAIEIEWTDNVKQIREIKFF